MNGCFNGCLSNRNRSIMRVPIVIVILKVMVGLCWVLTVHACHLAEYTIVAETEYAHLRLECREYREAHHQGRLNCASLCYHHDCYVFAVAADFCAVCRYSQGAEHSPDISASTIIYRKGEPNVAGLHIGCRNAFIFR